MKQINLIHLITNEFKNHSYIHLLAIGGSFARIIKTQNKEFSLNHPYSNIDLYLILNQEKKKEYESQKILILEQYEKLIYIKENETLDTFVFLDGLILKLHYMAKDASFQENVKILYDETQSLSSMVPSSQAYSPIELGTLIDSISLNALEFYREFMVNDYPVLLHLLSTIHLDYSSLKHYAVHEGTSKLASKDLIYYLSQEERKEYLEIIKLYSFDKMKDCLKLILDDCYSIIVSLPITIASFYNIDFFEFVRNKIKEL